MTLPTAEELQAAGIEADDLDDMICDAVRKLIAARQTIADLRRLIHIARDELLGDRTAGTRQQTVDLLDKALRASIERIEVDVAAPDEDD